jgi:trehalose/maltose transport system permease protein
VRGGDRRLAAALLGPALVVLAGVTLVPAVWVLWLSLRRRVPVFDIDHFVGLRHYAFLASDPGFWNAAEVTLVFTATSVAAEIVLGVAAALALARQERGRALAMGLLLLPWCLPGVVTARAFEWIYQPSAGLANIALRAVGVGAVDWLGEPRVALAAVVVADVWRTMPFVALLCYARLQSIPIDVYEAAAVDGASASRRLWSITLPLLLPVLLIATLFRTLDALRAFDLMFVLTGGGPAATTETLTLYAYRSLFQTLQLGFGSAVSTVVFVLVGLTAWAYLRALERREAAA